MHSSSLLAARSFVRWQASLAGLRMMMDSYTNTITTSLLIWYYQAHLPIKMDPRRWLSVIKERFNGKQCESIRLRRAIFMPYIVLVSACVKYYWGHYFAMLLCSRRLMHMGRSHHPLLTRPDFKEALCCGALFRAGVTHLSHSAFFFCCRRSVWSH